MTKTQEISIILEDLEKVRKDLDLIRTKKILSKDNEQLLNKLESIKDHAQKISSETQTLLGDIKKWKIDFTQEQAINLKPNKESTLKKKIKIAFFGTPSIASSALESIYKNENFEIVLVVTNTDQFFGRNQSKKNPSEVSIFAQKHNLKTIKTDSINRDLKLIKDINFDYLVTCAFGQILNKQVLALPKKLAINVHASLLPKGRGGAPIHWAIISGETTTGISMMKMIEEMDAGDVYIQNSIKIDSNDTYDSLYSKLSNLIKQKTASNLLEIDKGKKPIKQDLSLVTKWPNISKKDSNIDWNLSPEEIHNTVRGLYSKPIASSVINDLQIKICKSKLFDEILAIPMKVFLPGEIVLIQKEGILVATKFSYIWIKRLIIPGKKEYDVSELINGNIPFKVGDIFKQDEQKKY